MSTTLRDQLLGLGFKDAPKPKPQDRPKHAPQQAKAGQGGKPAHAGRKPDHKPGPHKKAQQKPRSREDIDLAKAYAIRAQKQKDERIEAERQKQEAARERREARARLAQLLQGKALNDPAADIARHFEYGGKIKRVHVTEAQLRALNAGELGVVQLDGRYLLVDAATLDVAAATYPPAVALRVDPAAPAADDPYADPKFQVPDDLVW